jgi:hypothetical protein
MQKYINVNKYVMKYYINDIIDINNENKNEKQRKSDQR